MTLEGLSLEGEPRTELATPAAAADVTLLIAEACGRWGLSPACVVALHGSRVEGFANSTSDIDVWVISPEGVSPSLLPVFEWVDRCRLQPESISSDSLSQVATRVNAVASDDAHAALALSVRDIDTYYRFSTSVTIANDEGATALRRTFNTAHVAALLAARQGVASATQLAKAALYLAMQDELQAVLSAREAVEFAADSFLARNGEAYPNRKWRFEKLARRFGRQSAVYRDAWALKSRGRMRSAAYVRACRAFVETHAAKYTSCPIVPRPLQKGNLFRLVAQDYLLVPSTAVYAVSAGAALLWQLLEGAIELDGAIATVSQRTGADLTEARANVYQWLSAFRAHGLVELMPVFE